MYFYNAVFAKKRVATATSNRKELNTRMKKIVLVNIILVDLIVKKSHVNKHLFKKNYLIFYLLISCAIMYVVNDSTDLLNFILASLTSPDNKYYFYNIINHGC